MNMLTKIDMAKATRLTREGRLEEAMAVLRGEGRDGLASNGAEAGQAGAARLSSPIHKVASNTATVEGWTAPKPGTTSSGAAVPALLQGVLDRMKTLGAGSGLDGLVGAARSHAVASVPDDARFETRNFANQAGSRDYKIYVPSGYDGQAVPLVVMLHGCTQKPDDFAAGTRMNALAEEQTFLVAYPAQAKTANASKCWNWFRAGDQHRNEGEPALIAGITRQIMQDFAVEPGRVYVAGLSAGGAAAAIMGQTYPELYAAIGVHSGLACGAAIDMASAFTAMRQGGSGAPTATGNPVPTIVFHGDRDGTVSPINGDQVITQSKASAGLRSVVDHGETPDGMTYTRTTQVDGAGRPMLEQWLLHGAGHAWSGGSPDGSYTEPHGPDASREMMRFFRHHATAARD